MTNPIRPQFGQTAIVQLGNSHFSDPAATLSQVQGLDMSFLGTQDAANGDTASKYRTTMQTQFGNLYLASSPQADAVNRVVEFAQSQGLPTRLLDLEFTPEKARESLLNFTGSRLNLLG